MPKGAETSDRVSSIAARYSNITTAEIVRRAADPSFRADIHSMAFSLLRQDQTKGLRGKIKKILARVT